MTLLEHLEELRRRILWYLLVLAIASIAAYTFVDRILEFLSGPVGTLVFIRPAEAFMIRIKIAAFGGFFISLPYLLFQAWGFAAPGLMPEERRWLLRLIPLACILFLCGALFAFCIVVPTGVRYLISFAGDSLQPMLTVGEYFSFVFSFTIAFGVIFQLPLLTIFLTAAGILTPRILREQRRYVVLGIFILAAIITPPDVYSQMLVALPTLVLYEVSILLASVMNAGKTAKSAREG